VEKKRGLLGCTHRVIQGFPEASVDYRYHTSGLLRGASVVGADNPLRLGFITPPERNIEKAQLKLLCTYLAYRPGREKKS
jgi:hypothetical protein